MTKIQYIFPSVIFLMWMVTACISQSTQVPITQTKVQNTPAHSTSTSESLSKPTINVTRQPGPEHPISAASLSLEKQGKAKNGILKIQRAEIWSGINSIKPTNGVFLILLGELASITGKEDCPKAHDFVLDIGGELYETSYTMSDFKSVYQRDYPGEFRGHCVTSPEPTFVAFDVPVSLGTVRLIFQGIPIDLGDLSSITQTSQAMPTMLRSSSPSPTITKVAPSATDSSPQFTPLLPFTIFKGVKVYYGVKKTYAFEILGGAENCQSIPSGRGVKVRYPNGSSEWKDRNYLLQAGDSGILYVDKKDPALSKFDWVEYFDCP